LKKTVGSNIY